MNFSDKVMGFRVVGEDKEGNQYRMAVKRVAKNYYDMRYDILIELPFSPDHRIWEELRN